MKEKFKTILEEHGVYGEDVEEVLYAVREMMEYATEKLKETEPYATVTIREMENSAYYITELTNLIYFEGR